MGDARCEGQEEKSSHVTRVTPNIGRRGILIVCVMINYHSKVSHIIVAYV